MILYVTKDCPYCESLIEEMRNVIDNMNVIILERNGNHNIPAFPALYDEENNVLIVGIKLIDYLDNAKIDPFHKAYVGVITNSIKECNESEVHLSK